MDCSPPGSSVHGISLGKNAGVGGVSFPPAGDLTDPETELESAALQVDSLQLSQWGSHVMGPEPKPCPSDSLAFLLTTLLYQHSGSRNKGQHSAVVQQITLQASVPSSFIMKAKLLIL